MYGGFAPAGVAAAVFLKLTVPAEQEEGGVPVMLGNTELAEGEADPYTLTEVDMMPSEEPSSPQEAAEAPAVEQPMITQQDEPSLQVKRKPRKRNTQEGATKENPGKDGDKACEQAEGENRSRETG